MLEKASNFVEHLDSFTITKTEWNHNNNVPHVLKSGTLRKSWSHLASVDGLDWGTPRVWSIVSKLLPSALDAFCSRKTNLFGLHLLDVVLGLPPQVAAIFRFSLFAAHTRNVYDERFGQSSFQSQPTCAKGPNLLAKGPDFRHICVAFAISCFFEVSKPPGKKQHPVWWTHDSSGETPRPLMIVFDILLPCEVSGYSHFQSKSTWPPVMADAPLAGWHSFFGLCLWKTSASLTFLVSHSEYCRWLIYIYIYTHTSISFMVYEMCSMNIQCSVSDCHVLYCYEMPSVCSL